MTLPSTPERYKWPFLNEQGLVRPSTRTGFASLSRPVAPSTFQTLARPSPSAPETTNLSLMEQKALWDQGHAAATAEGATELANMAHKLDALETRAAALVAQLTAERAIAREMSLQFMNELLTRLGDGRLRMDFEAWRKACAALVRCMGDTGAVELEIHSANAKDLVEGLPPGFAQRATVKVSESARPGELIGRHDGRSWAVSVMDAAEAIKVCLVQDKEQL